MIQRCADAQWRGLPETVRTFPGMSSWDETPPFCLIGPTEKEEPLWTVEIETGYSRSVLHLLSLKTEQPELYEEA